MKFPKIGYLNLILIFIAFINKTFAAQPKTRYIVAFPPSIDPFAEKINTTAANIELLMQTKKLSFVAADLNVRQFKRIGKNIRESTGVIELNSIIFIDSVVSIGDPPPLTTPSEISTPLDNIISCKSPLNNVDFIVIDNQINRNHPELQSVKITLGPVYPPDAQPCNPHSTQVTSIILGRDNGLIPNGDRGVYNIVPFNCRSFAFAEDIIKSFNASIQFGKINALKGRRSIITYPGIGTTNLAINLAASEVVASGIPFFVGAGNEGININLLKNIATATGVFAVGATQSPGVIPASYSNFGNQVRIFLPGNVPVPDENTNKTVRLSGTAAGARLAAALAALEFRFDMNATPAEIYDRITAKTRVAVVTPPPSSHFHTPIKIMLKENLCPADTRLFNNIRATKKHSLSFVKWFGGVLQNDFCVKFSARTLQGPILIGLRKDDSGQDLTIVKIGDSKHINSKFANAILNSHKGIVATDIHRNVLKQQRFTTFIIRANSTNVMVDFDADNKPINLMFSSIKEKPAEIAFSSIGGGVRYKNGIRCL